MDSGEIWCFHREIHRDFFRKKKGTSTAFSQILSNAFHVFLNKARFCRGFFCGCSMRLFWWPDQVAGSKVESNCAVMVLAKRSARPCQKVTGDRKICRISGGVWWIWPRGLGTVTGNLSFVTSCWTSPNWRHGFLVGQQMVPYCSKGLCLWYSSRYPLVI